MEIKTVMVAGAGVMGRQMALLCALNNYDAVLYDMFPTALQAAKDWTDTYLQGRVSKGKMTQEAVDDALARLTFQSDAAAAAKDADLVIEAIIEKEDVKKEFFQSMDQLTKPEALLTTNSSFIPSSVLAPSTNRPGQVANLHFFNPAMVMKLVEVVQGEHTAPETVELLMAFARSLGKNPISITKEIDGFVVNRLLRAVTEEAIFLVKNGYVTPQEIDIAAEQGANWPLGPFRLMDMTGIDIAYLFRERRYQLTGDESERPPKFLEEKYLKGEYGRKTGRGWYDYTSK